MFRPLIDTRTRKKGESLPELAQDIKRLVRLPYSQAPQETQDSIAYRCSREAINDFDVAWAITQSNIDTTDDALNLALKYEAFHSSHRRPFLRKLSSENVPHNPSMKHAKQITKRIGDVSIVVN